MTTQTQNVRGTTTTTSVDVVVLLLSQSPSFLTISLLFLPFTHTQIRHCCIRQCPIRSTPSSRSDCLHWCSQWIHVFHDWPGLFVDIGDFLPRRLVRIGRSVLQLDPRGRLHLQDILCHTGLFHDSRRHLHQSVGDHWRVRVSDTVTAWCDGTGPPSSLLAQESVFVGTLFSSGHYGNGLHDSRHVLPVLWQGLCRCRQDGRQVCLSRWTGPVLWQQGCVQCRQVLNESMLVQCHESRQLYPH